MCYFCVKQKLLKGENGDQMDAILECPNAADLQALRKCSGTVLGMWFPWQCMESTIVWKTPT